MYLTYFFIYFRGFGETKKTPAFRRAFAKLGALRTFVRPGTPVLALTATATKTSRLEIYRVLHMKSSGPDATTLIYKSPNRPNVRLSVHKVPDLEIAFKNVAEQLTKEGITMAKTIIYCKTVVECATIYMYFAHILQEKGYIGEKKSKNRLFAMYHHSSPDHIKSVVLQSLLDANGIVRVVFATNALGMGIDVPNIRHVLHFGIPRDIEAFMQELGRAGRDNHPAENRLYYSSHHLNHISQDMKKYVKCQDCRRSVLLEHFGDEPVTMDPLHTCCDNCQLKCECLDGKCEQGTQSSSGQAEPDKPQITRQVDDEDREDLKKALEEIRNKLIHQHPGLYFDQLANISSLSLTLNTASNPGDF